MPRKSRTGGDDPVALRERLQRLQAEVKTLRDDNDRLSTENERNARAARRRIDAAALGDLQGDEVVEAKVQALNNLHQQKVRLLMKSVNSLRDQLSKLQAEGKQHRRSAMINQLREQVRAQELVSDVLKQALVERADMEPAAVNEIVIKKTLGGPKRFRPKSREELENELATLERKHGKAVKALKAARAGSGSGGAGAGAAAAPAARPPPSTAARGRDTPRANGGALPTQDAAEISAMMQELETLRVQVQARERTIRNHQEEIRELHEELRSVREFESKFQAKERKYRMEKERARKLQEANAELLRGRELEAAEREHVSAELELLREERARDVDGAEREKLQAMQSLQLLQQRELEMQRELEHHRRLASTEQRSVSQSAKDAERALGEAEKRLAAAEAERDRLAERNKRLDARVGELQERLSDQGSQLSTKFDSLNRESASANERVRRAQAEAAAQLREAVADERDRAARETRRLEKHIAELERELAVRKEAWESLSHSKDSTEQSLQRLSSNAAEQTALIRAQTKQIADLEHSLADAVERAGIAEHDLHTHRVELERAANMSVAERHEALAKVSIDLQATADERDALQEASAKQQADIGTLRQAVSTLNKQVAAYRITLRDKNDELRRLEAAHRQLRAGYD